MSPLDVSAVAGTSWRLYKELPAGSESVCGWSHMGGGGPLYLGEKGTSLEVPKKGPDRGGAAEESEKTTEGGTTAVRTAGCRARPRYRNFVTWGAEDVSKHFPCGGAVPM